MAYDCSLHHLCCSLHHLGCSLHPRSHGSKTLSTAVPQACSAPAWLLGAPGGSGQLGIPRVRPGHWECSHRLGCSDARMQPLARMLMRGQGFNRAAAARQKKPRQTGRTGQGRRPSTGLRLEDRLKRRGSQEGQAFNRAAVRGRRGRAQRRAGTRAAAAWRREAGGARGCASRRGGRRG